MITSFVTGVLAIAGTLLGAWFSRRGAERDLKTRLLYDANSEDNSILRDRSEELYVLIEDWINGLSGYSLSLMMVMQSKLDYNQHLDLLVNKPENANVHFSRLEMLLYFYFPHLEPEFQKVLDARSALNTIDRQHKQAYEAGDIDGDKYLKPYVDQVNRLERAASELKEALVKWYNNTLQPTASPRLS